MRRLPGLLLPLLVLGCTPARPPAPAPASPATPDITPEPTIDRACARRESAALLPLTRADAPRTRLLAIAALGRIGDAPAIARLLELLADPSLLAPAASALGIAAALGSELGSAESAVLAAWSTADAAQRTTLATALGRLGTARSTPALALALADPDPRLAAAAALALGVLGRRGIAWDPTVEPAALALAARSTPEPAALAARSTPEPATTARPTAPTTELTYATAYALAHAPPIDPREPVDAALLRLAAAPDPETRALVQVGLTRRKAPATRARIPFQTALTDPSPWVQVAAVRGLLALADDDATTATLTWARAQLPVLADPARAAAAHPILEALERLASTPTTADKPQPWRQTLPAAHAEANALYTRTPTPLLARAICQLAAALAHDPSWRPPLRCPDPNTRDTIEAGVLAAGFGGDARLPRIEQLLASPGPLVRAAAITAAASLWTDATPNLTLERLLQTGLADPTSAVAGTTAEAIAAHLEKFKTTPATLSAPLFTDLRERTRGELQGGDVELYAGLTAALAATGRPEALTMCQAGLRNFSPTARKAARDCVTRLAGDPGPQTPLGAQPWPPHDPARIRGKQIHWYLNTERGPLEIDLDPEAAPWHIAALVALTLTGFYDGLPFHRVVPGFVAQGGDPQGTGWGGPGFTLPSEPGEGRFTRGAVGIADAGKDSGGSQFFLMHARAPHLEGRYTRVGELRRGFEVLDALQIGDRILRATVTLR
jgi:peptidylprolyl isomerase